MTELRRRRLSAFALLAVGGLLALGAAGAALASTARSAALGGFSVHATAPGVAIIYTDPDPTVGAQGGTIPEATTDFATGFGHALASVVWPGSVAGNAGGLAGILSIPDPLQSILKQYGNDPVRAEASTPSGPADASYPPGGPAGDLVMKAHADASKVESLSTYSGFAMGPATFGSISAHSISTTSTGLAQAQGDSTVSNIAIGSAGAVSLVSIDSVTSSAHVETDGSHAKTSGSSTVTGLKIAGVPATVDGGGVHLGSGSPNPIGQVAASTVDSIIAATGLKIALAQPSVSTEGAKASYVAGALVVQFSQGGQLFTVTLGGASATANSSAAAIDTSSLTEPPVASPAVASTTPSSPEAPSPPPAIAAPAVAALAPAAPEVGPARLVAATGPPFTHVPAGIILLGLAAAGFLAAGIKRLPTNVLAERPAAASCPLSERHP